ncbi:amidophosphoribosyltransferase [Methanofollis aquaemaris]|uniref:Amidophosphoribosyltransferase n=1 Tax=Methanofollis aquaemaris TaxID=126734 RepID=A0A8A3S6W0_9EURY|nr:amidophosphoribosyltransferase [Methanofollis aquaemaris]QSZ67599.1 amidophosphoribosyltransferase [Methanofollis aquaemaris]
MCGIVGIVDAGGVSFPLYYALYALQHRGQESAGMSTFDHRPYVHKGKGLVAEVFDESILQELKGTVGIGHVRYPTTGANLPENIQPFNFVFRDQTISLAHNGNLVNTDALRAQYERDGQIFCTSTDSEVIATIIAHEIRTSGSVEDAVAAAMRLLRGSYSIVLMLDETLYAFRDPLGIKPLCLGRTRAGHIVASESVAIDALNGTFLRDVRPGELVTITADGVRSTQIAVSDRRAHCMFEYVYFARADSVIDGTLVYDVRRKIGEELARGATAEADLVAPVPDSGTAYAIGYSTESGTPYLEGLMKNRYMGRTFIMPNQQMRENAVRIKLNPIRKHLEGKSVVLVDDSVVRGTTSRRLIDIVRDVGAKEVHLRVGSPPIVAPCYLGVDFPTRTELIAHDRSTEEVCNQIHADSLYHVPLCKMVDAIGIDIGDLCTACLTGEYPVEVPGEGCACRKVEFVNGSVQSHLETE